MAHFGFQFVVVALFDDPPVVNDGYGIGRLYCGQTVRDDDARAAFASLVQRFLHGL